MIILLNGSNRPVTAAQCKAWWNADVDSSQYFLFCIQFWHWNNDLVNPVMVSKRLALCRLKGINQRAC